MSATVDANLLLYASDAGNRHHDRARELLDDLAAGPEVLYLFWPVIMAYLRIATHPRIFDHPLEPARARANVAALLRRPHLRCPGEGAGFWAAYETTVADDVIRGNLVPDSHLVALMHQYAVRTIWTADRDFSRFNGIVPRNPFA